MPARVGFLDPLDGRRAPPVPPLGLHLGLHGAPALPAPLHPDPFGEFAFGCDLVFGEHLDQCGVVLQRELAPRRRDPFRQRGNLRTAGPAVRLFVEHREPS
ncbi:hypothetical protein [Nocardia sp. NPDC050435]|uniref:hypothetical protein n=1 Tax=Nocardia sp. NPDC050435 TaxID=3155040 RepID=UPI0033FFA4C3